MAPWRVRLARLEAELANKSWIVIRHVESGACEVWEADKEFDLSLEQVAGPFDKKTDATAWIKWVAKDGILAELGDEDDVATISDDMDL